MPVPVATEVTDVSTFSPTAVFMPTLADRRQEKVKLFADWQPDDRLALQFSAEGGTNKYSMPSVYALQNTRLSLFSLDMTYALSDTLEPQWLCIVGPADPEPGARCGFCGGF
jgi:hypothetical protein